MNVLSREKRERRNLLIGDLVCLSYAKGKTIKSFP